MKQAMVEHSSSASHSFLLDDDSTLPFVANEILAQMDDKVGGGIGGSRCAMCVHGVRVCRLSCWHAVCLCRASRQQQAHLLHCVVVDQAVLHCTPVCPCLYLCVCAGPVRGPASARRPEVRRECWQLCFPGEGAAVQPNVTLLRRCCGFAQCDCQRTAPVPAGCAGGCGWRVHNTGLLFAGMCVFRALSVLVVVSVCVLQLCDGWLHVWQVWHSSALLEGVPVIRQQKWQRQLADGFNQD